ncbi:MAG: PDZ domain-containing protein [Flavobacteriales bacterium]
MIDKLFLFFPLAAVFQGGAIPQVQAQDANEHKVRIEIVTTENGETKTVTHEFDANDEAQIEDALRELGVMAHLSFGQGDGQIDIDIRRYSDEDGERSSNYVISPLHPLPPHAPMPPDFHGPVAYLGVSSKALSEVADDAAKNNVSAGAYVTEVIEDTPAARLGLKEGDVITHVDGTVIDGPDALVKAIRAHEPNETVKVEWVRFGKKMNGNATLAERKPGSYAYSFDDEDMEWNGDMGEFFGDAVPRAFLGVTPGEGDGAVIGSVEEGTAAETMGIRSGDVVKSINGSPIADFDALAAKVKEQQPGDAVKVTVLRDGKEMTLNGTLGERKGHTMRGMREFHFEGMAPEDREELRREMDQLRREMSELRRELGADVKKEVRIKIESMPLSDEEKALLKAKGVKDLDAALELKEMRVFPNPSNGFFRIQFDVPASGDLFVNVHDATGEKVYEERITGFKGRYERTLDLTDKATGTYFLVVQQGGRTATQKLMKQ